MMFECSLTITLFFPLLISSILNAQGVFSVPVSINLDKLTCAHSTSDWFLSVALGCDERAADLDSPKVLGLARLLGEGYARFGGTCADEFDFVPAEFLPSSALPLGFDVLYNFTIQSNWRLLYDLNVLIRTYRNYWDPSNFELLLLHCLKKNYTNLLFELGNEPNTFKSLKLNITPSTLAQDFVKAKKVLSSNKAFEGIKLVGADITPPDYNNPDQDPGPYMREFVDAISGGVLNAFTWHQYYFNGKGAVPADFINVTTLNQYATKAANVKALLAQYPKFKSTPMWMGETSSAYNSGSPGISDRYIAGFMWLDKLGIAAQSHDVVIRQSFFGGYYSLLNQTWDPTPDYWLSLVYKHTVGTKVLRIKSNSSDVRFYAHCTNPKFKKYQPGSVTLYGMNLNMKSPVDLDTKQWYTKNMHAYSFTPSGSDLLSTTVKINGKEPLLQKNFTVTNIQSMTVSTITMDPLTFGIYVFPDANVTICS